MPCQYVTVLCSIPLSYQKGNRADTFPMEKAAISHMAASITQLTICQVATEEIETATTLLAKAKSQLLNIPEVLPQQIADLETAMQQLHQLIRSLHSCTTAISYEVSEAQKAVLLLPRTNIGPGTSREEHCATQAFPTH